jgi:hypothetical protein
VQNALALTRVFIPFQGSCALLLLMPGQEFTSNHQEVEVKWSGVAGPGTDDMLAMYVGPAGEPDLPSQHTAMHALVDMLLAAMLLPGCWQCSSNFN